MASPVALFVQHTPKSIAVYNKTGVSLVATANNIL